MQKVMSQTPTTREPCPTCGALPCDHVLNPSDRALTPSEQAIVEKVSKEFVAKAKAALEPLRREMQIMRVDPALSALQWGIVVGVATAYGKAAADV